MPPNGSLYYETIAARELDCDEIPDFEADAEGEEEDTLKYNRELNFEE